MVPHAFALTTALVASICQPALAQTEASRPLQSGPLDAQATVPATVYRSTLGAFRAIGSDTLMPWREANVRVGSIGGWRVYAREAQQPSYEPATAVPPPTPAAGAQQQPTR
jgi:hypothetical protein